MTVLPAIHALRCWPEYFKAIRGGRKRFEIRINERDFHVEDYLVLCEYDPVTQVYSGDQCAVRVIYRAPSGMWRPERYVVMSIAPWLAA